MTKEDIHKLVSGSVIRGSFSRDRVILEAKIEGLMLKWTEDKKD